MPEVYATKRTDYPAMLQVRDSTRFVILAIPVVYLIHNTEEYATMDHWITNLAHLLPAHIAPILSALPTAQLRHAIEVSLLIATLLPILVIVYAYLLPAGKFARELVAVVTGIMLLNGIQHVATSLFFLQYTPGVLSAAVLTIPFSVFMLRLLLQQWHVLNGSWRNTLLLSVLAYGCSLGLIWAISLQLAR